METVFSVGSAPRLYKEDTRPTETITERVLEMVTNWLRIDSAVVKK
jgi:hypothetical protein